ncbi:VanZ family protein [Spongiibacter sp. KMU-158]|uniref:VanZ family protein n=1 Tax=Spongiibacter pelagi TaxID=2760804 RepID=A0A927C3W4_9GAMM|nr:VanZ family protein [Spongiibacter pelagi]MBD2859121.1 VanZ family protein [Spongiibacter pelagi]
MRGALQSFASLTLFQKLTLIALVIYAAILGYATLLPAQEVPTVNVWDKALHFAAYMNFMLLTLPLSTTRRALWRGFWLIVAFGAAGELLQELSPGRQASAMDLVANALGALTAYIIGRWGFQIGKTS